MPENLKLPIRDKSFDRNALISHAQKGSVIGKDCSFIKDGEILSYDVSYTNTPEKKL